MESVAGRLSLVTIITIVAIASSFTYAYDPSPLQNICVAVSDNSASVFVNGKICKNPKLVTTDDFLISGLHLPASTKNNPLGTGVKVVDVNRMPGLNTLGISIVRTDFAPDGLIPIHTHPRATELIIVLEGSVYIGFVNSVPGTKSKLFAKVLKAGDVFAIPIGLPHFQYNVGNTTASLLATFNSQDFGVVSIPNDIFGTDPPISPDMLAKGFQVDKKAVEYFQSRTWYGPNVVT